MDKRLAQIEKTRFKITSFCKKVQWLFLAIFALYCFGVIVVSAYAVFPPQGFKYVGPTSLLPFFPMICNVVAGGLTLFIIWRIFRVIGNGRSPFCPSFAKQTTILGAILLISTISGIFIEPGMQIGSMDSTSAMTYEFNGSSNDLFSIDFRNLLAAIACFALSTIISYGAALQDETDDLL